MINYCNLFVKSLLKVNKPRENIICFSQSFKRKRLIMEFIDLQCIQVFISSPLPDTAIKCEENVLKLARLSENAKWDVQSNLVSRRNYIFKEKLLRERVALQNICFSVSQKDKWKFREANCGFYEHFSCASQESFVYGSPDYVTTSNVDIPYKRFLVFSILHTCYSNNSNPISSNWLIHWHKQLITAKWLANNGALYVVIPLWCLNSNSSLRNWKK